MMLTKKTSPQKKDLTAEDIIHEKMEDALGRIIPKKHQVSPKRSWDHDESDEKARKRKRDDERRKDK